ncbi:MAG: hypothetical protein HYV63_20910 [Candidatus Schekmanbacteria bacterium]|nr:hypothetical protein [Candidatus Schekmanbacteria bacterium]
METLRETTAMGSTLHSAERKRLASTMPRRLITVAQDETSHPQPCLASIEPVSDFILLER